MTPPNIFAIYKMWQGKKAAEDSSDIRNWGKADWLNSSQSYFFFSPKESRKMKEWGRFSLR